MKITYKIRLLVGYRDVIFTAHDELEMAAIVKILLKGEPEKGTGDYKVSVSVDYEMVEEEDGKETDFESLY